MKKLLLISLFIVSVLTLTLFFSSCGDKKEVVARDISAESDFAPTIVFANDAKNSIKAYYEDSNRKNFLVENMNSNYKIALGGFNDRGINEIRTAGGKLLYSGAGLGFAETEDGFVFTTTSKLASGRINTNRMGYYYYQVAIRDLEFAQDKTLTSVEGNGVLNCGFEETLHTYSDKVHNEVRIIFNKACENVSKFGYIYNIDKSTVSTYEVDQEKGYIGFVIKNAGVLGFIMPSGNDGNAFEVVDAGDYYRVKIYKNILYYHDKKTSVSVSHRVYTSEESDLSGLIEQAYCERNPLTIKVTGQASNLSNFYYSSYNVIKGAYEFRLDGTGFHAWNDSSLYNTYFGGEIEISGDDHQRNVYVFTISSSGSLEGAAILDENKMLLPMSPQVSKNFGGEFEEKYYEPYDVAYGNTIYPVVVGKNETLKHTVLNVYSKWGKYQLKQISSISFHIGYYHLSTGMTETNCIAPYYVYGRDGWTLPDFRGCSGTMWSNQPQYNSVGRLYFVSYFNKSGIESVAEYTESEINSSGLTYADIDYSYTSDDGYYDYTLSHIEYPQNDENRTYYTIDLTFNKKLTIESLRDNFSLFSFDGRYGVFEKTSYLDANGQRQTIVNDIENSSETKIYTLNKGSSYVSYYNFNSGSIENFGIVIKDYDIKIGGFKYKGNLCFRNSTFKDSINSILNLFSLSIDKGKTTFIKGDYIKINFVLLPFGTINQDNDDNVLTVYEDSALHPLTISNVAVGTLVDDPWLAIVRAEDNVAEFSVTGSRNVNTILVQGFEHIGKLSVVENVNGEWKNVKLSSSQGYDGYQINYMEDGYFQYSFCFNQSSPEDIRTFRVTVSENK